MIDAGGLPILLPLNDESEAGQEVFEALLDLVDGVVLTGGGDVHPVAALDRVQVQGVDPHQAIPIPSPGYQWSAGVSR